MASIWVVTCLFLYFCVHIVKAEECVTYDFEYGVESLFLNDQGVCSGLNLPTWITGNYTDIGIDSPDSDSSSFISANSALSCGSTFEFGMEAGGTLEVKAYMESNVVTDLITVMVMQAIPGSNDAVVGSVSIIASDSSFVNGWQTLRIASLVGTGSFQGYVSIMGIGSISSIVLVDSFRYIPPDMDEDTCEIYGETPYSTTDSTTESNAQTIEEDQDITTQEPIKQCVTYNFESDFDVRFSTDNYLCDGFLPWQLNNYTYVDVEKPSLDSKLFITPREAPSCISSAVFKMEPGGIVEANVFMEPVQALDYIIIIAQRVTSNEYDTVAGFVKYHPGNPIFVQGWNVIRFSLLDLTSFDGYIIFIGSADASSTVLVDSIRYIPPQMSSDDTSCELY